MPDPTLPRIDDPVVSVVICNHNHAAYLGQAIASALQQTVRCDVIVVDDGSTDDSRRLLRDSDPRVRVHLQTHAGQAAAYNAGLAQCLGNIVIFLDADDVLETDAAARVGACFAEDVAKVHYPMRLVDHDGRLMGGTLPSTLARGDVVTPLRRHGLLYPSPPGSGNAYRASVLRWLFPLPVDPGDLVGADFFAIYGAVAFGRVAACDVPLARYRVHRRATRPDAAAAEPLVFGNAALGNDEAARVVARYARLVPWVAERTEGRVRYPARFRDFSVQKSSYAACVVSRPYLAALAGSRRSLTALMQSLWLQPAYGWRKKLGLSAWAVLLLLAPRSIGFKLARHVCDPASRAA